jgi:hypothetical protein
MLATSSYMRPYVIGKTNCLWAVTLVKYLSWVRVPSGCSPVYERTEVSCQYQDVTRYRDGCTHIFGHLICMLTPVVVYTQPTLAVVRDLHPRPRNCLPAPPSCPSTHRCARGLMADENRGWNGVYARPGRRCCIGYLAGPPRRRRRGRAQVNGRDR